MNKEEREEFLDRIERAVGDHAIAYIFVALVEADDASGGAETSTVYSTSGGAVATLGLARQIQNRLDELDRASFQAKEDA